MSRLEEWQAKRRAVPKGLVEITTKGLNIRIPQGAKPAVLSQGYSGWQAINRPRQNALVEWLGHDPMMLTVPVMFDDLTGAVAHSVENDIKIIEKLTHKSDKYSTPPAVWVIAQTIPVDDARFWVLNDIKWEGDDVRRTSDGHRIRASAQLDFFEFIVGDLIKGQESAAKRRRNSKGKKTVPTRQRRGSYIVKEGETLKSIAKKELGSADKWHEIAKLNNIRDSKAVKQGQRLKMP